MDHSDGPMFVALTPFLQPHTAQHLTLSIHLSLSISLFMT